MRELLVNIELVYFIYVRKSTDVEDKQILSVAAQIIELKEFAKRMDLRIAGIIVEKQTAKKPGRPKFNKMLERIEGGEASGILAWLPDRLSRNSIDSGRIIYMLDENVIADLKFPHFWFQNTPQGKYMLANEFNSSKQYVDNLSVNTKRGLRAKVRAGHCPRLAPVGYVNDIKIKTITVDKKFAPIIRQAFELYTRGNKTLDEIAAFLFANGIKTRGRRKTKADPKSAGGKQWHATRVTRMLGDVFYYGHFRYFGEVHEGKHKAIISKKLFDQVQATLVRRGKPQKGKTEPQVFCGLLRCGSCNMAVTAEHKVKHQKNGNTHEYVYYRCTKKRKDMKCLEAAVTEPELAAQLTDILHGYAMPKSWAKQLETMLDKDEKQAEQSSGVFISQAQTKLASLQSKLQRLLDGYLDQDIDQQTYRAKRGELMSEKKSLQEQMSKLTLAHNAWIEPMRQWIKQAYDLNRIAKSDDFVAIKSAFLEMDGLNLFLKTKKAQPTAAPTAFPPKNIWLALRAAQEKRALSRSISDFSPFLVRRKGLEPS